MVIFVDYSFGPEVGVLLSLLQSSYSRSYSGGAGSRSETLLNFYRAARLASQETVL